MKLLFIGGTGQISTAVTRLCIQRGYDLTLLNRGSSNPEEVKEIISDINDESVKNYLENDYDCVVDWIAFNKKDVERDYSLFKGRTKQYIFISSASAYRKPVVDFPITEKTPLINPYWEYSQNKIECEQYLNQINDPTFKVTIIRPSHTYDEDKLMLPLKEYGSEFSLLKRMQEGREFIIPGDGTSLWTITHNSDFAEAFIEVLGNKETYNQSYHITSDKVYTWEQLYNIQCSVLGVKPNPIHIPTDFILKYFPEKEGEFYGDKHWSVIFDNSKIKEIAPDYIPRVLYEDIAPMAINHYLENEHLQNRDLFFEQKYEQIIEDYKK